MKIIKPSFEILDELNGEAILQKIELCGRVCYKSEDKITAGSAEKFVRNIIKRGHESVLEHFSFTVKFICDRGISHQIVRHRLASFSQEATRYRRCDRDLKFIEPRFFTAGTQSYKIWEKACADAETKYWELIKEGNSPQEARSVLPNSLKTELIVSANLREWRHILRLRTGNSAHPQMKEIMIPFLDELKNRVPVVFDDIGVE